MPTRKRRWRSAGILWVFWSPSPSVYVFIRSARLAELTSNLLFLTSDWKYRSFKKDYSMRIPFRPRTNAYPTARLRTTVTCGEPIWGSYRMPYPRKMMTCMSVGSTVSMFAVGWSWWAGGWALIGRLIWSPIDRWGFHSHLFLGNLDCQTWLPEPLEEEKADDVNKSTRPS